MTDRIQEITEKIYTEGVVKAKDDAGQIISEAKSRAEEIIKEAKKQKEEILATARKQSLEIKSTCETELQLAARQFTSKLKQHIAEIIITAQLDDDIKEAFEDKKFIREVILTMINNWNPQTSDEIDLRILLPEKTENEINTYFESKAANALNNGVEIKLDQKIESGFKIGPKDGSYVLSFSDKDFENFFKRYLKDRTKSLLFGSVDKE